MFRSMLLPAVLALVPLFPVGNAHAEQPTPGKTKTVRLLTIGNSLHPREYAIIGIDAIVGHILATWTRAVSPVTATR